MSDKKTVKIELRKATELARTRTTASGVRSDFIKGKYPLFYHAYKPDNAFVAVPPTWLEELAKAAGEFELAQELNYSINEVKKEKGRIIKELQEKARKKSIKKE